MFRRILVPLDGSSLAERALSIAARIARALSGTIVLVRVVTTPVEMRSSPGSSLPSAAIQTMTEVHRMEANSYLRRIAASEELRSIPTEIEVCVGQAAPAILSVANASNIDLLIMCRYGQRGRTHWMLGSVAEKVVYDASVPLLLIHDGSSLSINAQNPTRRPFRVLVPLDGSPSAEAGIMPTAYLVAALAEPSRGVLDLIQVVDLPAREDDHVTQSVAPGRPSSLREQVLQGAQTYLNAVIDRLNEEMALLKLSITWSLLCGQDGAETLLSVTENEKDVEEDAALGNYDLLAMSRCGRGGMQHRVMGSITGRMLRTTNLPILIVQPQALRSSPLPIKVKEGVAVG